MLNKIWFKGFEQPVILDGLFGWPFLPVSMPPELKQTFLFQWREGAKIPDPGFPDWPNTGCLSAGKLQYEGTSGSVMN